MTNQTHSSWVPRPPIASAEQGGTYDFGDPQGELDAVATGSFVANVSHLDLLEFSGEDATRFLQGQLSCDVEQMAGLGVSSYGSYCNPKGRMLASFLLWPEADRWRMVLSRSIAASIQKRLGMYVLRSKVWIANRSDTLALIGAGGPGAIAALRKWGGDVPLEPHRLSIGRTPGETRPTMIALPGQRWILIARNDQAQSVWTELASGLKPIGISAWELSEIRNGIPLITAKTQEQFIPQMTNLDLIGGVSFKKGCYPGQEIVARTQYLGKVKRHLYLAHVESSAVAGDELYSEDVRGQSSGMVVNAAPAPGGGYDVLAVVLANSAIHSSVHLRAIDGALLKFAALPYPVS